MSQEKMHTIKVDLSKYEYEGNIDSQKSWNNQIIDKVYVTAEGNTKCKITKRTLENEDQFFYFEVDYPQRMSFDIEFDKIMNEYSFDHLYKKPKFDKRYGENKLSGPYGYFDLEAGSCIISKVYQYNLLTCSYENEEYSQIFEMAEENSYIEKKNENIVGIDIFDTSEKAAFFLLLSKNKLFQDTGNLYSFMEFYFQNVLNNSVWSSFFVLPSGTYTKLPYSIEPFTKHGYGFNLHHSSKKELLPFLRNTGERFFESMMINAALQAHLYQKNEKGIFYTPYTSTWLKNDTGITAPYIDTKLNETFIKTENEALEFINNYPSFHTGESYCDFLCDYYAGNEPGYMQGEGFFFPDYFKQGLRCITHASLNHQVSTANLLREMFRRYNKQSYLNLFKRILTFIEESNKNWINKDTGDLYYGVRYSDGNELQFFGNDYRHVTLCDLLMMQYNCVELNLGKYDSLTELIKSKTAFLKQTPYDVFNKACLPAPGEDIGYSETIRNLYYQLYDEQELIDDKERILSAKIEEAEQQIEEQREKSEESYKQVQELNSKYIYEQNKSEERYRQIQALTSKYEYERNKAEELYSRTQELTSKFNYEQNKANRLQKEMAEEAEKYQKEMAEKAEKHQKEMEKKVKQLEQCQTEIKEKNKKIVEAKNQSAELQRTINGYNTSILFRMLKRYWSFSGFLHSFLKKRFYKIGHWGYYKLLKYPRTKALCSRINGKLKIYKYPDLVINYNDIANKNAGGNIFSSQSNQLKKAKELNVAMIVDEFTYNSFRFECNALFIEPDNWKKIFEKNEIDIFLCESAWAGIDPVRRPWKGKIYCSTNFPRENRMILFEILEYCSQNKIPTVFWNKEDPTFYGDKVFDFCDTASRFDHIFTTAKECVERYKKDYAHKSVHLLMFGTQPQLFNPIEKFDRTDDVIFAGSWYKQHPERSKEMEQIFDNIIAGGCGLKVYDRHSESDDPNHKFPDKYKPYLHKSLPHDQMDIAYKGSRIALNINTVKDSDTMFARRVFELMSSNTLVLSNYSKGVEELFGDNVVFVDGRKKISLENIDAKRICCLYEVLKYHTYGMRFQQILNDIKFKYKEVTPSVTFIYTVNDVQQAEAALKHFSKTTWQTKKAILALKGRPQTIRELFEKFQRMDVQVKDLSYLEKYGNRLFVDTDYFIWADANIKKDFIGKAILHFNYLNHNIGIFEEKASFKIEERVVWKNVLYSSQVYKNPMDVYLSEEKREVLLI